MTTGTPVVKTGTVNGQILLGFDGSSLTRIVIDHADRNSDADTAPRPTWVRLRHLPVRADALRPRARLWRPRARLRCRRAIAPSTTTTTVAQAATSPATTPTTETAAQAVVAAVTQLANAQSAASTYAKQSDASRNLNACRTNRLPGFRRDRRYQRRRSTTAGSRLPRQVPPPLLRHDNHTDCHRVAGIQPRQVRRP